MPGLKVIGLLCAVFMSASTLQIKLDADSLTSNSTAQIVPFTLEEVLNGKYTSFSFNGSWISPTEIIYQRDRKALLKLDVTTLESTVICDDPILEEPETSFRSLSADKNFILIGSSSSNVYRHSTLTKYTVLDLRNGAIAAIAAGERIHIATWAPRGNALIYVEKNDIYYRRIVGDSLEIRRLTFDGKPGVVYNGIPDWVYEEEVLQSGNAMWFSPNGDYLAFATFNDTTVKEATLLHYGEPGNINNQYPKEVKIKYPKAGTTNPTVTLYLIDLMDHGSSLISLRAPTSFVGGDHILYTVSWLDNKTVTATWTNRVQNVAQIVTYDLSGNWEFLLTLEEPHGWLEISPPISNGRYLLLLKSQEANAKSGSFRHVTRFDYEGGRLSNELDLTPGTYSVQSIVGHNVFTGEVYFTASPPNKPFQRHLHSVQIDGKSAPNCISCVIKTPEGNDCKYAKAEFSEDMSHYVLSCYGPDPLTVNVYNSNNDELFTWEDNESLRKILKRRKRPIQKDLVVKANGFSCDVRLLLPPDFDERKTYPMLVQVYAGPGTQRITDSAVYGFETYMATNRSVIHAWIDGRGSSSRGSAIQFAIYRALGTVEIEDQITVTKTLQEIYPWIDANRTAIWGWSYGGYSTAMILATDKEGIFQCGVSVAPVSSWIYYDSIYTERYMGLPTEEDNLVGYNRSDVTRRVKGLSGKKFMLVHGTGDDNVHYQQAMALGKALIDEDILFEQVTYTDEAHGLTHVTSHFYHTLDKFWSKCFNIDHLRSRSI